MIIGNNFVYVLRAVKPTDLPAKIRWPIAINFADL